MNDDANRLAATLHGLVEDEALPGVVGSSDHGLIGEAVAIVLHTDDGGDLLVTIRRMPAK